MKKYIFYMYICIHIYNTSNEDNLSIYLSIYLYIYTRMFIIFYFSS